MANPPTLASVIGLSGPVFLRKLRRKADWRESDLPIQQRVDDAVRLVFLCDPNPYSFFRVETLEEFHRVVIGLNGGRQKLTGDSSFLAVLPQEFEDIGVHPHLTLGKTRCSFANALHYDASANTDQLSSLCRRLMEQNRGPIHLTQGKIRPLAEEALKMGCLVDPNSIGCRVARCAQEIIPPFKDASE